MMKKILLTIFILLLLMAMPGTARCYQERLIVSLDDGKCSLRMEADDQEHILRLRVHPGPPECYATREKTQAILKSAFAKADPPKLAGTYHSLFLGRLNDYPWLAEYLALTAYNDPRWDRKKGKPVSMDLYKYVRTIFLQSDVKTFFEEAFGDSGYRIVSVTLEKICVGRFSDLPLYRGKALPGKIPCDAVVWFRLEKKQTGSAAR